MSFDPRRLASLLILSALFLVPACAATLSVDGSWSYFAWTGSVPVTATPTYDVTSASPVLLRVVDTFAPGDMFSVAVTNTVASAVTTYYSSRVPAGPGPNTAGDPVTALTQPSAYSFLALTLAPGSYSIEIAVTQAALSFTGSPYLDGGAYISAGAGLATPEPATPSLLGAGLLGLMGFARRRR
jgi:hypothetical protein